MAGHWPGRHGLRSQPGPEWFPSWDRRRPMGPHAIFGSYRKNKRPGVDAKGPALSRNGRRTTIRKWVSESGRQGSQGMMARRTSKRNLGRVSRPTSPLGTRQDFRGRSMRRTISFCCRKPGFRGSRSVGPRVPRRSRVSMRSSRRQWDQS
eukprot:16441086-Heterocapsa_arctica.AAC.2